MMNFAHPHFAEPEWLLLAVLAPLLLGALHIHAARARRKQLGLIASPHFVEQLMRSHSPARRWCKNALLVLVVFALGLALARPQWGEEKMAEQQLAGEDIVFAVDCSHSMWAADVAPNRIERARYAIRDFVSRRTSGRVGLVAFAGQAFLQCPLTYDYGAFEDSLLAVDDKTIGVPGTDVGRALDESFQAMEKTSHRKLIVLITDGEDLEKGGVKVATALAKQGVVVFTVGVGTPGGAEIKIINEQGQPELMRDEKGQVVHSRLDEATLRQIAQATGGNYYPLGALGEGLANVQRSMATLSAASESARTRKLGVDRFHIFIAGALVLLVGESLFGTRRREMAR